MTMLAPMKSIAAMLAGMALLWTADRAGAQGTVNWNESVNGPLSNNYLTPTSLGVLRIGTNTIIGTSALTNATTTGDFFTISIPIGSQITSLFLIRDRKLFVLIGNTEYTSTLGYSFDAQTGDLMTQFQLSPIGSGLYGFEVDNNDFGTVTSIANYQLNFIVQPVPEPGTLGLFALGAGALAWARSRKPV